MTTQLERFTGFSEDGIQFLLELQAEQNRAWFKAHQADFDRLWKRPLEAFVFELRDRLAPVFRGINEVEPHFFRIQRDTRFARDKSPYKTYVAANMPVRAPTEGEHTHSAPGVYVSFGLEGEFIAIGSWHMPPEVLARYRAALDHPRRGPEAQRIYATLKEHGWDLASMETLKRVPPPFAQDHPRAELLRRKGLAFSVQPQDGLSATPGLLDWSEQRLREAAPMVKWLDKALAA
jgi:uncharacterized protein (TIGR02453 family)